MDAASAADFFANLGTKPAQEQPSAPQPQTPKKDEFLQVADQKEVLMQESISRNTNWNAGTESLIKKNLMVGNYEYAAECALKIGRVGEAFLIAKMGGPNLLEQIQ